MSVADEIQHLQDLHRNGALSDEEFAKAKAAVIANQLASSPATTLSPHTPPPRWQPPWKLLTVIAVLLAAFFSNPDRASLEKTCRQNIEEKRAKSGSLEKLIGNALVDFSFERKNYYLFSVGTVTSEARIGLTSKRVVKTEVIGLFGRWWLEFPVALSVETK